MFNVPASRLLLEQAVTMNSVQEAFQQVKRANFLPVSVRPMAGLDQPLPIGHDQTNSQPTTVRRMLTWLDAATGQTVLDIGSGSGWTTALLAHIVGPSGKVYGVERVPELVRFGQHNCNKLHITNVKFYESEKRYGLSKHAPYDRILVSASASEFPNELLGQLKAGGKMVAPVQDTIYEVTKLSNDKTKVIDHPGYVFVPLI